MQRLIILLVFLAGAAQAQAQVPMGGEEFDAYTRGQTLTFIENGQAYGIEQYLSGRRVIWAFENGACLDGYWSEPAPGVICFVYQGSGGDQQCWNFFQTDTGLLAKFIGAADGQQLYEARRSRRPLLCLGPEVGV